MVSFYFKKFDTDNDGITVQNHNPCFDSNIYIKKSNIESVTVENYFSAFDCCLCGIFCIASFINPWCIIPAFVNYQNANFCCERMIKITTVSGAKYTTLLHGNINEILNWYQGPQQQLMNVVN